MAVEKEDSFNGGGPGVGKKFASRGAGHRIREEFRAVVFSFFVGHIKIGMSFVKERGGRGGAKR